jgi:hypothetical protein
LVALGLVLHQFVLPIVFSAEHAWSALLLLLPLLLLV